MSNPRPPRKYLVIWEKIKKTQKCVVEVHPAHVSRVKKAVIKEKNNDLGFKLENDHDYFFLKVEVVEKDKRTATVTFILKQRYGLEGVKDGR